MYVPSSAIPVARGFPKSETIAVGQLMRSWSLRVLLSATLFSHHTSPREQVARQSHATPNFVIKTARNAAGQITRDATTAPTGYSPVQIRQAYNLAALTFGAATADGSGQTIAIVDAYADPTLAADLHTFDSQSGLADPTLSIVNESGGSMLPGTDPAGPGNSWALETSLDVEWAHAMAPGASIKLVQASSSATSDLLPPSTLLVIRPAFLTPSQWQLRVLSYYVQASSNAGRR